MLISLEKDIFPRLGHLPIDRIKAPDILAAIRVIEKRGVGDTASRALQRIRAVFNYAVQTGKAIDNPALCLTGIVVKKPEQHMPALPQSELPEFFRRLAVEPCRQENRIAMVLLVLTFVRPGTLRLAEWAEIDRKQDEWRIPKEEDEGP